MKRADKQEDTRRKLLAAAAEAVGEYGYGGASVAKITGLAGVAQGTFYNYFESQEDLFNQLLPALGNDLLDFIRERVANESDSLKREELGFRAFFDFLEIRPEFYRVLNDAEAFSPQAYHQHMSNMATGYVRALSNAWEKGELKGFEPRELEVLVFILLSARNYLSYRFSYNTGKLSRLPEWVVDVYMKFVSGGFGYAGVDANKRKSSPTTLRGNRTISDPIVLPEGSAQYAAEPVTSATVRATLWALVEKAAVAVGRDAGFADGVVDRISIDFHGVELESEFATEAQLTALTSMAAYVSVRVIDTTDGSLVAMSDVKITTRQTDALSDGN